MSRAYKISHEAFVIPEDLPVPGVGRLPVNAMVLLGKEPMILDTLAIVHRDYFLEEVFNIVEPEDVRWLFLSHEDRDHSGSIMQVLARCPKAKLVTNFLGLGKLHEEFDFDPRRIHILNDGGTLDIGDRTVAAIRPPLYDSSATTGIWDPKSEIYYGADCFGVVTAGEVPHYIDDMKEADYEDGFFFMNRANHIWFEHVKPEALAEGAERIKSLGARMIVSGHGPVERRNVDRMCDMIKRIGDMPPIQLPDNDAFVAMLDAADAEAAKAGNPAT
ncbi:MBL fold metallo-hydrolase [Rhizobium sp. FKL33]|uniref:MBL fold metallo-hydrolase n=1 Tax=Rhizobium sp. FKL33 TaxID=2562307 RepID=UPI0010C082BF|nr:MBL fold metallo-hydrolase [Rhizobium sp. FKL33]